MADTTLNFNEQNRELHLKIHALEADNIKLQDDINNLRQELLEVVENIPSVPSGTVAMHIAPINPEGWLKCEGQEVSRSEYPELFREMGT